MVRGADLDSPSSDFFVAIRGADTATIPFRDARTNRTLARIADLGLLDAISKSANAFDFDLDHIAIFQEHRWLARRSNS